MPILEKIADIQADMPVIAKTGKGPASQGGYSFMKVDDIITALRPRLAAARVVVRTETLNEDHEFHFAEDAASMDGTIIHDGRVRQVRVAQRVLMRFTFIDAADGTEFPVEVLGEAFDTSDKATRKAITQAHKVALMQTFLIHDGEPEADAVDGAESGPVAEPRQDRGAQARSAAAGGGRGRQKAAQPAALAKAEAALAPEVPPTPAPEQSKPAAKPEVATTDEAVAATDPATGEVPPSADWTPAPEDVAHAQAETAKPAAAAEPEPSAGPVAHDEDNLDKAKARLRMAVAGTGGISKEQVDAIGRDALGQERAQWITSSRAINAIAARIEKGELTVGAERAAA
jgi:hypothetical protein